MNKNLFYVVLLIIVLSFIYQEVNLTGYTVYNQGDSFESGGRTVKVTKISKSSAVFDVDGVKNIISTGEHKNINGVDIKVINIFYVDEPESRNVDISINVIELTKCGDGKCQDNEDSNSCCKDCGCPTDYRCKDNECIYGKPSECRKHEDCDDENPDTIDLCVDLNPEQCKHYNLGDNVEITVKDEEKEIVEEGEIGEGIVREEVEDEQGFFSILISFFKNIF